MAYNFKNLADVELLNTMPENAKVIVEVDGATKRAPKEDGIGKLVSVEALAEVPENATVLAEVNGEIKRVPGSGLGGGKTLIIKQDGYDNIVAGIMPADLPVITFTANMTYAEALEALVKCEFVNTIIYMAREKSNGQLAACMLPFWEIYYDQTFTNYTVSVIIISFGEMALYWTAEGGLSLEEPERLPPS